MLATNGTVKGKDFNMNVCIDPPNKRLRVDEYVGNVNSMIDRLNELAKKYAITKVIMKAKSNDMELLLSRGYMLEAIFKRYFSGDDAYGMVRYYDPARRTSEDWIKEDNILNDVLKLPKSLVSKKLEEDFNIQMGKAEDAGQLAELYAHVFETYPTPMNQKEYIEKVMSEGTIFFIIKKAGRIISAASAEINDKYSNAEITDCATLPEFRKHGLMKVLIDALEKELFRRHIFCSYSIARSLSFGMNASFHQLGYTYTGRFIKNCDIFGNFEDMSVWTKDLSSVTNVEGIKMI
ncbi:putative beta-lysine N-acetyltransferase [Siminovitchia terrae]|uniref:putative beta-lysine N-acetyltransferase n=1 Tax=Siminovitchia terrae TaxID=1914933 RepID=UPI001B2E04B7|nr:putative beta-lysine N-acetyltransferase [Siminovitchia terrae]GIN93797.1 putative beta-lysine N-acetyltransferase [Siminovitchia terrae]